MKYQSGRLILYSQLLILVMFISLTISNELLDIPHYLLGDSPTLFGQRIGEMLIEVCIFVSVVFIEIIIIKKLLTRIKILEGILPICANCKKIRQQNQWTEIEQYITDHSLAGFSHTICPECAQKLYPELYSSKETKYE